MVKEYFEISPPQMTPELLTLTHFIFTMFEEILKNYYSNYPRIGFLAAFIFPMVEENFEFSPPQITPE